MTTLTRFLRTVADEIDAVSTDPVAVEGARQLRAQLDREPAVRHVEPSAIRALEHLDALPSHPLTDMVRSLTRQLPWIPSHRVDDGGANIGLVFLHDCIDVGGLNIGLMLVGPHDRYPEHNHAPAEVYLVLGGQARWRFGGREGESVVAVGETLVNHPNDRHGLVTDGAATVAIWILTS